ncbi:hypothetical protein CAOG_05228 [Capsaspora owczarzaki ATCC 30864]|uniref:hypothetical protein n=1 Tax=Capsaspora owczarzaki (strain ATCC 30864) TaxID=595528 RepID=UPI0001FE45BE|nr:hypothetical protein CAOG_05228 [Capsaspora owczarzaki ATCC 30864]|eukprot:XP_004346913.1 hypothetical protein CAOG_05228 [Capsaspora owczarzaki ATCC 30864]
MSAFDALFAEQRKVKRRKAEERDDAAFPLNHATAMVVVECPMGCGKRNLRLHLINIHLDLDCARRFGSVANAADSEAQAAAEVGLNQSSRLPAKRKAELDETAGCLAGAAGLRMAPPMTDLDFDLSNSADELLCLVDVEPKAAADAFFTVIRRKEPPVRPVIAAPPKQELLTNPLNNTVAAAAATPRQVSHHPSKIQQSLYSFFGGEDPTVPNYFHCSFADVVKRPATPSSTWPVPIGVFQRKAPAAASVAWRVETSWRGRQSCLVLTTDVPSLARLNAQGGTTSAQTDADDNAHGSLAAGQNIPLLKSHLQKCVRRGKADLAGRSARLISEIDMNQLLRRLPIIMIEDSILHSSIVPLVWLMAAYSKGYRPAPEIQAFVVSIAAAVAACPIRDVMAPADSEVVVNFGAIAKLENPHHRAILYSLQFRKAFGGMAGDMRLLDAFTLAFLERFQQSTLPPQGAPQSTIAESTWLQSCADRSVAMNFPLPVAKLDQARLSYAEWDLAAVDFHVSNVGNLMLQRLEGIASNSAHPQSQYARYLAGVLTRDPALLSSIIWEQSSSTTNKTVALFATGLDDRRPSYAAEWQLLGPLFLSSASQILAQKSRSGLV